MNFFILSMLHGILIRLRGEIIITYVHCILLKNRIYNIETNYHAS